MDGKSKAKLPEGRLLMVETKSTNTEMTEDLEHPETFEDAMYTSLNRILDEWFEDPKVREEFEEWKKKERSEPTAK